MSKKLTIFFILALGTAISGCSKEASAPQIEDAISEPVVAAIEIPAEYNAMVMSENGGPEVFQLKTLPMIEPGEGEILIKVVAAAVNPIERRIRVGGGRPPAAGTNNQAGGMAAPEGMGAPPADGGMGGPDGGGTAETILGGDLAGIVVKLGEGVTSHALGDAVFSKLAFGGTRLNGAYAQYAVAPANQAYPKPTDQTFAEASGLGTVGVTALRTIWHADVQEGERVFINGIGGGIGSSAAQFAKERGAYVLGTASGRHAEYLAKIGVDEHINYREVQFDEVITEPVDVVIETVGSDTANQALNIMTEGSRLVSISGPADAAKCEEIGATCSRIGGEFGWPNSEMLAAIAELAEKGAYRLNVDSTFPLEELGAAQEQNYNVGTSGKVVVVIDPALANHK